MMKHFILSISIILVILQNCNPAVNDVTPDETAKKIFTRTELEGIGHMIHFVDSIVSAKTGHTGINESYRAYIEKLSTDVFSGGNFTPLLNDSTKFQFLETIDNDAFSSIWIESLAYIPWESQCRKYLDLNLEGKYKKYLQEIGESDDRYASIYEDLNRAGSLSPVTVAWFLKNHQELDFTLYKHRLWGTVFLLRMPEPLEIPDTFHRSVKLSMETRVFEFSALPDKVEVKITNNTNDTIITGEHYHIEFFDNDQCLWRELFLPETVVINDKSYLLIFTGTAYPLKPGASVNFKKGHFKHWKFYSKGRHRIVVEYTKPDFKRTKEEYKTYAEFYIE
ncbi:immunoglobulin-like domain-containing protein [Proteiniphilum acetatigenes]|uniref:immunoglobulin-like domain-containing protein n=1 Tax=Proteiniphilum acetatigenes TaxID=294710 RepID=UPI00036710E9|nr:immunoglobulin-like domain-containing protein [Proteiniphilum acetatigenes]SFK46986.1 hypothetical protein SAMN05216357_102286 [Porphyromonadaceae bacterium KH3CP3RA]